MAISSSKNFLKYRITLPLFLFFKNKIVSLQTAKLGNTLGKSTAKLWVDFHLECKASYLKNINPTFKNIESLKTLGFTKLGLVNCELLAEKVASSFEVLNEKLPTSRLPRTQCDQFSNDIYLALDKMSPLIEQYYESYFQPYWISIQQNYPGQVTAADASFGWHIDDNPKEIMKIFLYLNDVNESNGAFRSLNYSDSRRILKKGFVSNSVETRLKNQKLVENFIAKNPNSLNIMEGKSGTFLMFDNNLVHKATPPEVGYRQLCQIEIYPSKNKFALNQVKNALINPIKRDYPKDPHFNDIADDAMIS